MKVGISLTSRGQNNFECTANFLFSTFANGFSKSLSLPGDSNQSSLEIIGQSGQQISSDDFTFLHTRSLTNGLAEIGMCPGQFLQFHQTIVGINPNKFIC